MAGSGSEAGHLLWSLHSIPSTPLDPSTTVFLWWRPLLLAREFPGPAAQVRAGSSKPTLGQSAEILLFLIKNLLEQVWRLCIFPLALEVRGSQPEPPRGGGANPNREGNAERGSLVMSADPTRGYLSSKLLLFPDEFMARSDHF